jgi:DNA-binding HxlR family transcriptional regulator
MNASAKTPKFGILERISYNEVPLRVEYKVTQFGARFNRILDELEKLQSEIEGGTWYYV